MSDAKRFSRDPDTLERKLATTKSIFESIFFTEQNLFQDSTMGIRLDKPVIDPIQFVFKDNEEFDNPLHLIAEYSFAGIFEREVKPLRAINEETSWQMRNLRIGLLKKSIKIEEDFAPVNEDVELTRDLSLWTPNY